MLSFWEWLQTGWSKNIQCYSDNFSRRLLLCEAVSNVRSQCVVAFQCQPSGHSHTGTALRVWSDRRLPDRGVCSCRQQQEELTVPWKEKPHWEAAVQTAAGRWMIPGSVWLAFDRVKKSWEAEESEDFSCCGYKRWTSKLPQWTYLCCIHVSETKDTECINCD